MRRTMTMGNIEKISRIDRTRLSGVHYFQSLAEQAVEKGMLSESECERMQSGCIAMLAKCTERYNNGTGSSIRVETAQSLLESIFYTIGIKLKVYPSPDDAVYALAHEKAENIYIGGLLRIEELTKAAKHLHSLLSESLINSPNIFYRSTAVDGINGFFKLYNPEIEAHLIHITADYPTFNGVVDLTGIEFIYKYVENLYYENLFLSYFDSGILHRLLCGIDVNYKDLLFNLYESVLAAALGCALTDKDIRKLSLSESDIHYIASLLGGKSEEELSQTLDAALKLINKALTLPANLYSYIMKSVILMTPEIKSAVSHGNAGRIFIKALIPENRCAMAFSFGEKMPDEAYRKIIDEIALCRYTGDKLGIIKEKIHSLADMEDVLLDSEMKADEITEVLKLLSPVEFAAFLKKYPGETGLPGNSNSYRENERMLYDSLNNLFNSLPNGERSAIENVKESITDIAE